MIKRYYKLTEIELDPVCSKKSFATIADIHTHTSLGSMQTSHALLGCSKTVNYPIQQMSIPSNTVNL